MRFVKFGDRYINLDAIIHVDVEHPPSGIVARVHLGELRVHATLEGEEAEPLIRMRRPEGVSRVDASEATREEGTQ